MRRLDLVLGSALAFLPSLAFAQSPPAPQAAPSSRPAVPPQALAPVKAEPVQEPPYNPAEHGGLSFGAYIRATRGTVRRSTGMMVTGILLDILGSTLMATGTGVWVDGNHCHADVFGPSTPNGGTQPRCGPMREHATGMSLLVSGTLGLGLGLPLTIYGASGVPRAEAGSIVPRATVAFGLRGAEMTLHF